MADMTTSSAMVMFKQLSKSSRKVGNGIIIIMTMVTMASAISTSLYRWMNVVPCDGATACDAAINQSPY